LNFRSKSKTRFAWTAVACAAAFAVAGDAWALGLGRLIVQSALGETLRAEIDVTSLTADEAASLRVRIAPPDAFRAAGVEYNAVLPSAQVQLQRRPDGRNVLRITSDRAVLEPFVDLIVEASWASGRLVREYTLLFDPPGRQAPPVMAVAPPAAAPAAPTVPALRNASPPVAAPMPSAAPAAPTPPRPPLSTAAAPAPATAPRESAAAAAGDGRVRVRPGDSLSRIADSMERPGLSLDQMLVGLYRANPQAFMGDNMNRLKAGSVLEVPSAEAARALGASEAREVVRAQTADFAAYRQRLASGVSGSAAAAPERSARGSVQASVDDRRQGAAPPPDQLRLSQGSVKASAPQAGPRPGQEVASRVAELSRNVEELKRLQQGAGAPAAATPAPAAVPAPAPAPVAAAPAAPQVVPQVVAQAPAAAPVPAPAAPPPAVQAPPPVAIVPPPPAALPPAPPLAAAPAPAAGQDEGFISSLLDNPLVLPGAGVLVVLLAGLGAYRLRGRLRKPAGETSFLESRLQPDSFFGASGGQRIDTREAPSAAGSSSSMSYSLSQLDAIGDVDPVAEADVYLAYGRDLQAEEILKEAMRATPERMAVRTKLLEVYAKRRDGKAFELLATQLFALTRGEGDDWKKAQEFGRTVDPDNPLYQPGGQPDAMMMSGGRVVEPLSATTMPQTSNPVSTSSISALPPTPTLESLDSKLDLDLDLSASDFESEPSVPTTIALPRRQSPSVEATQPLSTDVAFPPNDAPGLALPPMSYVPKTMPMPTPAAARPTQPQSLDFDLDSLSMDFDTPPSKPRDAGPTTPDSLLPPISDFGSLTLDGEPGGRADDQEALARKLDLAEEFRQIGDLEGARDLLEEVLTKADGALRAKAQGMLDRLA